MKCLAPLCFGTPPPPPPRDAARRLDDERHHARFFVEERVVVRAHVRRDVALARLVVKGAVVFAPSAAAAEDVAPIELLRVAKCVHVAH